MIVGTCQDLARLSRRSRDFLGNPEERPGLARKALRTRGKPRPDTSFPGDDLKTPPIYIEHYFLGTTPIIVELNPVVLTVALCWKDLAALRRPSARCCDAHLVKDDLRLEKPMNQDLFRI